MERSIRNVERADLPQVMQVFEAAKGIMRSSGNMHQWIEGYPSEADVFCDMEKHGGFVLEEAGRIVGYFAFLPSPEPTYSKIYDGEWLDDTQSYHVVHRIASYPNIHGIFSDIMDFCFSHDANIRIDTHKENRIMRHNIEKHGFTYCGIIYIANRRSSESHFACTNGRVATDEGEANSNERMVYQKLNNEPVFHQKSKLFLRITMVWRIFRTFVTRNIKFYAK